MILAEVETADILSLAGARMAQLPLTRGRLDDQEFERVY